MDFLNVGPWELVVVLIIAILVAGPKRMVEIARTMGQMSRQLRDLSREFTTALQAEIQAAENQAGQAGRDVHEVHKELEQALSGAAKGETQPSQAEPGAAKGETRPPQDGPRPSEGETQSPEADSDGNEGLDA